MPQHKHLGITIKEKCNLISCINTAATRHIGGKVFCGKLSSAISRLSSIYKHLVEGAVKWSRHAWMNAASKILKKIESKVICLMGTPLTILNIHSSGCGLGDAANVTKAMVSVVYHLHNIGSATLTAPPRPFISWALSPQGMQGHGNTTPAWSPPSCILY